MTQGHLGLRVAYWGLEGLYCSLERVEGLESLDRGLESLDRCPERVQLISVFSFLSNFTVAVKELAP
jgi:hypothetical protein